jgi:pimeloyl-ACP methyl ester carboxylesterase
VPLLEEAQHEAIAVDLPGDDAQAGLSIYADRVLEAIGTREVIIVAQSLGAFTAPLASARARVRMLVFVNAMIPVPGETAGEWWANTGWEEARVAAARHGGYSPSFDLATYFLHDVPPEVVRQGEAHERPEADLVFGEPCRFETWPAVPIHVIAGRDDRFFPIEFQRRVVQERLRVPVDELPGGHLLALANPRGLADQLLGYVRDG